MNEYWNFEITPSGHIYAMATEKNDCFPERRLYFSFIAFERDFGKREAHRLDCIKYPSEKPE